MFARITELTDLQDLKVVNYSNERSELINRKKKQKNDEFENAKKLIITGFDTAIRFKNSDKFKILLNEKGYNGTKADIGQLDAVITDLTAIIKFNKDIESNNAKLDILETEKKELRDSLSKLDAENEKKIGDLEAENNEFAKKIGDLEAEKVKIEEEKVTIEAEIVRLNTLVGFSNNSLKTKETTVIDLTKRIDEQNEEIAKLNVEILKHTANQNMLDIKIKHYQGLKETSNKAHDEQRSRLQKDIEELKTRIDELEKKSLEYDTDKIKREFDSELKDAIQNKNDNTIITSTGYVGIKDDLTDKFPVDSKVLYGENTDFKNMGDILSGIGTIRMSQAKNVTLDNFSNSSVLSINLVEMNDKLLEQTGIQ